MSGLAPIDPEENALIAEYAARQEYADRELAEWLPEWFLGKMEGIKAKEQAAKDTYAWIKERIAAEKNALIRRHGEEFKAIVDKDLVKRAMRGAGRKSVEYGYGIAGYRKSVATVTITDMDTAIEWCSEHCTEALDMKLVRKTPAANIIIGMIEEGGKCPEGFEYHPAEDRFFPDLGGVSALPPKQEEE